ncbi:MAG: MBOAT family protein, partial [Oscillospiraceae bacterium]|nr:MBOAT family protein [Oscillospiraceae bacterium]
SLVNWLCARRIARTPSKRRKKLWLALGVGSSALILFIFKYAAFFANSALALMGSSHRLKPFELPIGISFYTFQVITYTVDVYRRKTRAQKYFSRLLLYVSCFPQLIAGPIVQYSDIASQIGKRETTPDGFSEGMQRFVIGLGKKVIFANICGAALSVGGAWYAAFLYTLQIYFDFSGYSDMAIGMGLMCGFHYKENFNYPYISRSVSEFWRRWHISLGSFFRDYVYIPLGGNRVPPLLQVRNLFVVWALTGLWHGASWNFVLWGLFFGVLIGAERFLIRGRLSGLPDLVKVLGVFLLVMFSWILFKFTDFALLSTALKGLVGANGNGLTSVDVSLTFRNNLFFLLFCAVASTPAGVLLRNLLRNLSVHGKGWFWLNGAVEIALPVILLLLSAAALAGDSYNPFLYFRF